MAKIEKKDLVTVFLRIEQIGIGQKYSGVLKIGSLGMTYDFESVIPLPDKEEEIYLNAETLDACKILFLIKIYDLKGGPSLELSDAEFIFFHDLLYSNIKKLHFHPEISRFNEAKKTGKISCLIDSKSSIGKPIEMITVPRQLYTFLILKNRVPKTILESTQKNSV
ncbi:hypothetical protein KKC45_01315 [Patescibacteria group bacterium]|nr:hypothetical protein [Patescibacteria group bacterium]